MKNKSGAKESDSNPGLRYLEAAGRVLNAGRWTETGAQRVPQLCSLEECQRSSNQTLCSELTLSAGEHMPENMRTHIHIIRTRTHQTHAHTHTNLWYDFMLCF